MSNDEVDGILWKGDSSSNPKKTRVVFKGDSQSTGSIIVYDAVPLSVVFEVLSLIGHTI